MALIVDPDLLAQGVEVTITTGSKTIALNIAGDLSTDGITLKCLYSFLKEEWKTDAALIKFPFPMTPITDEQFEFVSGWDLANDASRYLIRTAGWAVRNTGGAATQMWSGVISLGTLRSADSGAGALTINVVATTKTFTRTTGSFTADGFAPGQTVTFSGFTASAGVNNITDVISTITGSGTIITVVTGTGMVDETGTGNERANASTRAYFIQEDSPTATTTLFQLQGVINQAVQVMSDPNGDGNYVDGFDYRNFLTLFAREWGDSYASSSLSDIGVTSLTYQAYRFPLTTTADPKIQEVFETDADATPYDDVDITWIVGNGFTQAAETTYVANDVIQDGNERWAICSVGGTLDANGVADYTNNGGSGTFVAFTGERNIPDVGYFPFSVIVDGNVNDADPNALAEIIYTRIQYQLRAAGDIDEGSGTRNGQVTGLLLSFVGDTLITKTGVWIDDFNTNDINRITFTDSLGVTHNFLYTASLTLNFGANLVADADAIYRVFFTNDDAPGDNLGYDYGTSNAILVNDASAAPMSGTVSSQASITKTFAFDSNVQRGAGSSASEAPITAVAIGLSTGQFVSATGTIARSTTNAVSLVAALERNYSNPV